MKRSQRYLCVAGLILLSWARLRAPAQELEPAEKPELSDLDVRQLAEENITLNVENVEIRSLLKLLAEARRLNIVAGPEVTGTISINLFQVPFEQAFDSILGIAGFTHYKKGDIVFVTTEAAKSSLPIGMQDLELRTYEIHHADLEDALRTVNEFLSPSGTAVVNTKGAAAGGAGGAAGGAAAAPAAPGGAGAGAGAAGGMGTRTKGKLFVLDAPEYLVRIDKLIADLDAPPYEARVFEIGHVDIQEVLQAVTRLLSPNGSAMQGPEDRLVVRDSPEYLDHIEKLIAELDVPPRQVLISAKILSVNRDDDLGLGVAFESSSAKFNAQHPLTPPFTEGIGRDFTGLITGQSGVYSMIMRDHEQGFLDALSTKSHVETIAAPQILAVDGEIARIQVGDNLGYRDTTEVTQTGGSLQRVSFLNVGTELEITPTITEDGLVQLQVSPKVSTGQVVEGLPQEKTTEAETVMLVRDGETVLIGGLLRITRQRIRSQVPVFGDIPVLGLLFGRNTWKDAKSELIILITPYIVGATSTPAMQEQEQTIDERGEELSRTRTDLGKIFEDFRGGDKNDPEGLRQGKSGNAIKWRRSK